MFALAWAGAAGALACPVRASKLRFDFGLFGGRCGCRPGFKAYGIPFQPTTQQYYTFGESTWDLVLLIGTGTLGPAGAAQTIVAWQSSRRMTSVKFQALEQVVPDREFIGFMIFVVV